MEPITFDGRVAIVTGAGGGLGRAYALELARRGARVVVNDLGGTMHGEGSGTAAADVVVAEITAAGGEAVANYDTVAHAEGGAAITQTALDAFGTVDIVINNAGILRDRSFANLDEAELRAVIDVHLLGAFHVTQPAYRVMKAKGFGRIVFTSSAAGILGNFGQTNYGAAKAGLVGLSNVLAIEGARAGILSNVIAPIATSRLLTKDVLGEAFAAAAGPEHVAPLVVYLASPACTETGQVFSVGGGRFARVFTGTTPGWFAPDATVEDIREHMAEISAEAGYSVLRDATEETLLLARLLGAEVPA